MQSVGDIILKGAIIICVVYLVLFGIVKMCWLAIRRNHHRKDVGGLVHAVLFAVAFVVAIVMLRGL